VFQFENCSWWSTLRTVKGHQTIIIAIRTNFKGTKKEKSNKKLGFWCFWLPNVHCTVQCIKLSGVFTILENLWGYRKISKKCSCRYAIVSLVPVLYKTFVWISGAEPEPHHLSRNAYEAPVPTFGSDTDAQH
jgi:hypothetical protein